MAYACEVAVYDLFTGKFLIVPNITNVNAQIVQGAHRGASLDFEENTLEAFEKAVEDEKYQFIEFDIQYSKDGEIVVFHQNTKYKLPKKSVEISELTYDELNSVFEYEIPLYSDAMSAIDGKKPIDIEIKSHGNFDDDRKLVDFIVNDCKIRGILGQIMISSPSEEVVAYVEENYPEVKTGKVYWITWYSIIPIESICSEIYETPADYVLLHGYKIHNYQTLMDCKPDDKTVMIWYFTDELYLLDSEKVFWEDYN